jgi:hypothetical protein
LRDLTAVFGANCCSEAWQLKRLERFPIDEFTIDLEPPNMDDGATRAADRGTKTAV